jgi:hypothetical protein
MPQTTNTLPYRWDVKLGRYRYTNTGKLAPRSAVLALTDRFITQQKAELQSLGERLSAGAIDLGKFQQQAGEILRSIHSGSAILGKGGIDKMTQPDWDKAIAILKQQLYKGRDRVTGKPYGIKHLAEEWRSGTVSPAQLQMRLGLYAQSGKLTYWEMLKRSSSGLAIRVLGAAEHCPECLEYAALPPQPIAQVVVPGVACSCRVNCRCAIEMV